MKRAAVPCLLILLSPAKALASEDARWTGRALVASDIVSAKGTSKTTGEPGGLARLERRSVDHYFGMQAETETSPTGADAEIQMFSGWVAPVAGYVVDLSAYYKYNTGVRVGYDRDMFEYRADITRTVGRAGGRLRMEYSPDTAGKADQGYWVEGQGVWRPTSATSFSAGLGRRTVNSSKNFTSWNMGVTRKLADHLSADLRWYDTNAHQLGENYAGRTVLALVASF